MNVQHELNLEIVDWGARDASLPAPLTQWIEARS